LNPKPPKHGFRHNDYLSILLRSWDMAKTLMLVAAILKSKIALIPLCYYHHNWPPRPRKHGFRHQNYPSILPRSWDMAYSLILLAIILKSNMAADKRKSQPGKLPIMILEILRNILIPIASFYPECLADLIFRHKFGFCPLTTPRALRTISFDFARFNDNLFALAQHWIWSSLAWQSVVPWAGTMR